MKSCDSTKVEAVVVPSTTGQLNNFLTDTPSIAVINYDIQPSNKETQNQPTTPTINSLQRSSVELLRSMAKPMENVTQLPPSTSININSLQRSTVELLRSWSPRESVTQLPPMN